MCIAIFTHSQKQKQNCVFKKWQTKSQIKLWEQNTHCLKERKRNLYNSVLTDVYLTARRWDDDNGLPTRRKREGFLRINQAQQDTLKTKNQQTNL